jgi:hypothetical protein
MTAPMTAPMTAMPSVLGDVPCALRRYVTVVATLYRRRVGKDGVAFALWIMAQVGGLRRRGADVRAGHRQGPLVGRQLGSEGLDLYGLVGR